MVLTLNLHVLFPPNQRYEAKTPKEPHVVVSCNYGLPSFWAPFVFNLILILACTACAFKTRRLPDNFHDTKCILVCGMSSICLWSPVLLVLFSLRGTAVDFLLALARAVNAHLMQSTLFLPKLLALYKEKRILQSPNTDAVTFPNDVIQTPSPTPQVRFTWQ